MIMLLLLLLLLQHLVAIDQKCSSSPCPVNSYCSSSYCRCGGSFIGDCSTPSESIEYSQEYSIEIDSSSYSYYSSSPPQLIAYYKYEYKLCGDTSGLYISLWVDQGDITTFSPAYSATGYSVEREGVCFLIRTPYIGLENQPNGVPQLLVLGIAGTSNSHNNLTLMLTSQALADQGILTILGYALAGILILTVVIMTIVYCRKAKRSRELRRRNLKEEGEDHDLAYFDEYMPVFCWKDVSTLDMEKSCAVCLIEFTGDSLLRKTLCSHCFHSDCLDAWCAKNLTCPICRALLSEEGLTTHRKEVKVIEMVNPTSTINNTNSDQHEPLNRQ